MFQMLMMQSGTQAASELADDEVQGLLFLNCAGGMNNKVGFVSAIS